MSNNCCPTQLADGVIVVDSTVINSNITGGTATGLTLSGGVTMDAATAVSIVEQICGDLRACIEAAVEGGTFSGLTVDQAMLQMSTLVNATLSGTVTLAEDTKASLASQLCESLESCIISTVSNSTLTGVSLDNASVSGVVSNSTGANNVFEGTRLVGPTTIVGQIPLDTAALTHLCSQLTPCVTNIVDSAISAELVAAVFQDCVGTPHTPFTRVPSCESMNAAIEEAIASLPAVDVIKGVDYDSTTNTLTITTGVSDGSTASFSVALDSLGGQVVTDGVTIEGTGVTGDKLRVIVSETTNVKPVTTGTSVPTDIHGGRTAILGQPDKWIEFNGYIIPAFNKPIG